jgi:large subunit ribosomal protein L3
MGITVVGKKCGMTQIFRNGAAIPVTVVYVEPNIVTLKKTTESDGYVAVQVTTGHKPVSRLSKAEKGHFAKAGVTPGNGLWEFRVSATELDNYQVGTAVSFEAFAPGKKVDVVATSKGKGFAGTIKLHNFSSQRNSHGNSVSHRVPGSIGQNQSPGRVFKGKKMCARMGGEQVTVHNLVIAEIMPLNDNVSAFLLQGAVPGAPGGEVFIRLALKGRK